MTFTEITHWFALALGVIAGSVYAAIAWGAEDVDQIVGALIVTVIVVVAIVVLYAVVVAVPLAIRNRDNLVDERDDAMEAGALPYSFSVLVIGTMWAAMDIVLRNGNDQAMDPVTTLNILLGSVFAAVTVGSVVTLFRYRVGTR